jgi:hypothetical protein
MPKKICLSWKSRIIFRSFSVFISEQASDCRKENLASLLRGFLAVKGKGKRKTEPRKYINVINSTKIEWAGTVDGGKRF